MCFSSHDSLSYAFPPSSVGPRELSLWPCEHTGAEVAIWRLNLSPTICQESFYSLLINKVTPGVQMQGDLEDVVWASTAVPVALETSSSKVSVDA